MANIFTKIQRKVAIGKYEFTRHCLIELDAEFFTPRDAVKAVLNAVEYVKLTHDESHNRYVFYGYSEDSKQMQVTVFISQGIVFFKTIYEYD